jgi:hypothetical protein
LLAKPLLAAVAALALAAAAPAADVKQMMKAVVDPQSTLLFAVGGEADPANDPPPKLAPARWAEAASAAARLEASAVSLQQPGALKDKGLWLDEAKKMATLSAAAGAAAKAHDGAKLSQAANDLSDVCSACHAKYKPQT